jgi:membrane protein
VLLRVFYGISEDRITTISGGVTFFVLLALFPGLAGLISLYGLFADSGTIGQHLGNLEGILPEGGLQILRDQLQQLASQPPQKLGYNRCQPCDFLVERQWWRQGHVRGFECRV